MFYFCAKDPNRLFFSFEFAFSLVCEVFLFVSTCEEFRGKSVFFNISMMLVWNSSFIRSVGAIPSLSGSK